MKRNILLVILFSFSLSFFSQTTENITEWIKKGNYAIKYGNYDDAIMYFNKIRDAYEQRNQTDSIYVNSLAALSFCYSNLGLFEKSIEVENKQIIACKEVYGENHKEYATSLHNLAGYYSKVRDYDQAVKYEKEASEVCLRVFGKDNLMYATSLHDLAYYYNKNGNHKDAIVYGIQALTIQKNLIGEKSRDYLVSLHHLAMYYSEEGDYKKAVEIGLKSVDIGKDVLGERNLDYSSSLLNVANYLYDNGDYFKAVEYGEEALDIRREKMGEDHSVVLKTIHTLALFYSKIGEYRKAIEYESVVLEKQKVLDDEGHDYAMTLNSLATFYSNLDEYGKAIEYGEEAIRIIKGVSGENNTDYALFLNNIGTYYAKLHNYSKALEYGMKALKLQQVLLGEYHPHYAITLHCIASYYSNLGDYSSAVEYGERALMIQKETIGVYHPDYAISLNSLSLFYSYLGNYVKAVEYVSEALTIEKNTIGANHPDHAIPLINISHYYALLGNVKRAIEYATEALEIQNRTIGTNHLDYSHTLSNLADYYYLQGDYNKAIAYQTEAMTIRMNIIGTHNSTYSTSLNALALYYSSLGNYSKAIEYGNMSIEAYKGTQEENTYSYARALHNLACCYSDSGDYSKAVETELIALEILRRVIGENNTDFATGLSQLADYYYDLGKYDMALSTIQKCLLIRRNKIIEIFQNFPSSQRSSYWNRFSFGFTDRYPGLFLKSHSSDVSSLYDLTALFSKGLLLTTDKEMNKLILENGDKDALEIYEDLRNTRIIIQKLFETPIAERHMNLDSLQQRAESLEQLLVKKSKVYGDYTQKLKTTWKDVQNALVEDEIAVEFLSFNIHDTDSIMISALTLRKDDQEPRLTPLFEINQLKNVSDTLYYNCPEIMDLVWHPLQNQFKGIRRIYFSPSGVLHKIGIEYVAGMENFEMYRLSTTREIIDMKKSIAVNQEKLDNADLYGGIDYEEMSAISPAPSQINKDNAKNDSLFTNMSYELHRAFVDSLEVRGTTVKYLPGTLNEVMNIRSSFMNANQSANLHTGKDATESSVKKLSSNCAGVLHISTHGFYFSVKQAQNKKRMQSIFNNEYNSEDKSLTRSGLLMAGANKFLNGKDVSMDEDDGILTAQEISKLDFRKLDLVVLSACETAKGDIMQGEGVFGLQRGFKKAGAKSILMSLWKVSDAATNMLMSEFYINLCNGKDKHESLRMAQKKVCEYKDADGNYIFQDPYFWAGFVMLD